MVIEDANDRCCINSKTYRKISEIFPWILFMPATAYQQGYQKEKERKKKKKKKNSKNKSA